MNLADQHGKNRADLVATRTTEAGKLATLKVERAAIDGERKAVEAEGAHYRRQLLSTRQTRSSPWTKP
jgi:hypothetical protein